MSDRTILLIGSPCKRPRCFDQARLGDEVLRVSNVSEALNNLRSEGGSAGSNNPVPALVFVSSTVGSKAMAALVSCVRDDERLSQTAIVILTSAETSDAGGAFEPSSKDYLVRVSDTDTLLDVVSRHLPENGVTDSCRTGMISDR